MVKKMDYSESSVFSCLLRLSAEALYAALLEFLAFDLWLLEEFPLPMHGLGPARS
ncbi:hypothetical protein CENSYa_0184 [Cenarchaeum symbiosum A]|uniref:Uncharacterized protein n=1 Tax=Cenarchaeum symbiosum (strain A) TaxID=414004 RepID=A0RU11_CENSY|nr:hypothetical protein CENSYa_0184 [Cenarchaeum symbiosum A]